MGLDRPGERRDLLSRKEAVTEGLLPPGTDVIVIPGGGQGARPYRARVHGYDMGRTKYELSLRMAGWGEYLYGATGGSWAFLSEVHAVGSEEDVERGHLPTAVYFELDKIGEPATVCWTCSDPDRGRWVVVGECPTAATRADDEEAIRFSPRAT